MRRPGGAVLPAAPPPVFLFVWSFAVKKAFPWHVAVFLAPALLIYSLFSALPLADTLRLGLYTSDEGGQHHFAGLANYATILFDPQWSQSFWNAMWNNCKFFLIHMLLQNPIGLLRL